MIYLVALFAIAVAGMLFVIARHIRELFQLDSPTSVPTAGEVQLLDRVTTHVRRVEEYTKHKMKPMFFTSLAQALKWAEQRLIALVRGVRKFQRELSQHAKVSPKESQYWKNISDWKAAPKHEESLLPKPTVTNNDEPPKTHTTASTAEPVIGAPELVTITTEPPTPKRKRSRVVRAVVKNVASPVSNSKSKSKGTRKKKAKVDELAPEPDNQLS